MLPHYPEICGGIHSESLIEMHVMPVINTHELNVLRTSFQGTAFNFQKESLSVTPVLVRREDDDFLEVICSKVIVFLEKADHEASNVICIIPLDEAEGILNRYNLTDTLIRLIRSPSPVLIFVVIIQVESCDGFYIRLSHN